MPLNIKNILSSSINDNLGNLKKTNDVISLVNNITDGGDINSLLGNILPTDYVDKLKNLNLDVTKLTTNFNLLSNLNIDKNKINDDFSKINNSGIKFTSINDLKNQDLSKLNMDKNFIQNLNKMENNGLNILDIFNSFLKLNTIGGPDKVDDLLKKVNDWLNIKKTNSDKNSNVKREKIKLPNPGEIITMSIYEDQLPYFEKILKKEKFSKLSGDNFKSVSNLISLDSNISSDDNFIGKYIISYFVGNKSESWDIAQKGAIKKISIDQNQISLTSDYNKNVDMVTHHIHIALLKNIKPVDQKLSKDNATVTKFEKNLNVDKERGIKILVPSQYLDVFQTSKWGGYNSFITTKFSKQLVWYDNSYDRPDFYPNNITKPSNKNRDGSSNFDIGVHIGQPGGKTVGNWSDDGSHCFSTTEGLNEFFELCDKHSKLYGNKFTYTLSTKDDFEKAFRDEQISKEEQRKKDEELAKKVSEQKPEENKVLQKSSSNKITQLPASIQAAINSLKNDYKLDITDENIQKEFDQEGNYREDAGGVNKTAKKQIDKLIKDVRNVKFKRIVNGLNSGDGIVSHYRSYTDQVVNFGTKAKSRGVDKTQKANTIPGFSQHHTGKAFDIFSTESDWWKTNSEVKEWVETNCGKYGFKVTYTEASQSGKLRIAEPWHLYYIGGEII